MFQQGDVAACTHEIDTTDPVTSPLMKLQKTDLVSFRRTLSDMNPSEQVCLVSAHAI